MNLEFTESIFYKWIIIRWGEEIMNSRNIRKGI